MKACEREPASENERALKIVREHQAKEKKSFNNPEPVTGFEHTVTFNLMGNKLVIPYGYLIRYSKDNATKLLPPLLSAHASTITQTALQPLLVGRQQVMVFWR